MSGPEPIAIRSIAAGGDGVGTLADGRTVFVPRTAPGDIVTVRHLRLHARFARAELDAIVTPGPDRVAPPCPHYEAEQCGGCQLMHLATEAQRTAKRRIVGDAVRRLARIDRADPELVAPGPALGYRAKVTLAVREGRIGFHRRGEPGRVFEVARCLLLEDGLDRLHQRVRAGRRHLPGDATHVILRRDAAGGHHVIVRTAGATAWTAATHFAEGLGPGVVTWWHPDGGAARALAGSDDPWPATVFEQVNPVVAAHVREHAVAELTGTVISDAQAEGPTRSPISDRRSGLLAWDLYAGIGESTAMLAERGVEVESVELDPRAVALAAQIGPAGPRRLAGDAATVVRRLGRPQWVLTNPPRAGMDQQVVTTILDSGAARVVYVSCDPGTLARDIRRLGPRYDLAGLTAFDQFPQTAHVECVATLERR